MWLDRTDIIPSMAVYNEDHIRNREEIFSIPLLEVPSS